MSKIRTDTGARMCEALGLDPGTVRKLTIEFTVGELATASAVLLATDEQGQLIPLLKRFVERPPEDGVPPAPPRPPQSENPFR